MLFNNFEMGTVPDPEVMNGDQVGIKLNQQIAGFTIEQDTFTRSPGNANNTIGISVENLGDYNNVIRKNTFSGLTLSNEAFGKNASDGNEIDGLRYICNENLNTTDKDFYVKNTVLYSTDNVSALQADFAEDGSSIGTGNQFASTGDQTDGDFANYGISIDEYYYNQSNSNEIPDATQGILVEVPGDPNSCAQLFCAPPCLSENDLANLRDEYYENRSKYEDAIAESEWLKALVNKVQMDHVSKLIVQHYLVDTLTFYRDSLRVWYANMLSVSSEILLAKDYAAAGNYAAAGQVLSGISATYSLNTQEQSDITDIQTIFGILSARSVDDLTQNDIDTLIDFSDNPGHCASMARGILTLHGYGFETQYVLPGSSGQGQIALPGSLPNTFEGVTIYPNPTSDIVNIVIPAADKFEEIQIDVWTLTGINIFSARVIGSYNTLKLPTLMNGAYAYRILADGDVLKTGRIQFVN